MGCFIVPGAEAIVTTIATHVVKKCEAKKVPERYEVCNHNGEIQQVEKISFSKKLSWLNKMLAGGSGLLMFEHVWHGEVVPFFPFLTAANDPAEFSALLRASCQLTDSSVFLTSNQIIRLFLKNRTDSSMKVITITSSLPISVKVNGIITLSSKKILTSISTSQARRASTDSDSTKE